MGILILGWQDSNLCKSTYLQNLRAWKTEENGGYQGLEEEATGSYYLARRASN